MSSSGTTTNSAASSGCLSASKGLPGMRVGLCRSISAPSKLAETRQTQTKTTARWKAETINRKVKCSDALRQPKDNRVAVLSQAAWEALEPEKLHMVSLGEKTLQQNLKPSQKDNNKWNHSTLPSSWQERQRRSCIPDNNEDPRYPTRILQ